MCSVIPVELEPLKFWVSADWAYGDAKKYFHGCSLMTYLDAIKQLIARDAQYW